MSPSSSKSATHERMQRVVRKTVMRQLRNNEEHKFLDASAGGNITVDYTGTINPVGLVTTGTGISNKIGSQIRPLYLELRAQLEATTALSVRYVVFSDTMTVAGATPLTSDVLSTTGSAFSTISPYNFENVITNKRFKIHHDITISGDPDGPGSVHYERRVPLGGIIGFQTGNVYYKNALWLLVISDNAVATGTQRWYTRLVFTDA